MLCQSDHLLAGRKGSLHITSFDEERPAVKQDVRRKRFLGSFGSNNYTPMWVSNWKQNQDCFIISFG